MLKEHDRIVLSSPIVEQGLEVGDVGTVIHMYSDGEAYEIEFVTLEGKTAAVVTVKASQVRPFAPGQIAHAPELAAA